jgi:predicted nucleic-acid-binding protein
MSKRRPIDTNLVIRHLAQDNANQAEMAGELFDACDRGEITIVLLPAVLAECVFVLESFYRKRRSDIAYALSQLITSPGIEMGDVEINLDALERYGKTKIHFIDCVIAAFAAENGVSVATLDRDFRKFSDVRVEIL